MTLLSSQKGLAVIDKVLRRPDLFPVLRVLPDRNPLPLQVSYFWKRGAIP